MIKLNFLFLCILTVFFINICIKKIQNINNNKFMFEGISLAKIIYNYFEYNNSWLTLSI